MRKLPYLSITVLFLTVILFSCKPVEDRETSSDSNKSEINVLTSFLPIYIFTMNVVEGVDGVNLEVLVPPELAGPHGFEPSPSDMKKIDNADIFIANGLGLETFFKSVKSIKPHLKVVYASDGIDPLPEVVGGHGHDAYNPHVWVSPFLAVRMVHNIAGALAEIDKANAEKYRANAEKYVLKLEQLGEEFKKVTLSARQREVVTIHNAFDYLARDTGFEVAAVLRVDPRSEPRSRELAGIAEKIRSEKVAAIFTEPQFPKRLAKVLADETGVQVYELDPMATGKPALDLYQRVMHRNLENLKAALGGENDGK